MWCTHMIISYVIVASCPWLKGGPHILGSRHKDLVLFLYVLSPLVGEVPDSVLNYLGGNLTGS